jgi:methylmalonyl-CoA/ethylmalonyl-CoA epimerase
MKDSLPSKSFVQERGCSMTQRKIDHIGIVVPDIHSAVEAFSKLLHQSGVTIEDHKNEGRHYKIAFISLGDVLLELIEPVNKKGLAQEHLDEFGPGVYHFALTVPDLDEEVKKFRDQGFEFHQTRTGAAGGRIAFMQNPILPGILLELVEPKKI